MDCRIVSETKQSLSLARNKGADIAKGNILCFVDADGVLGEKWLSTAGEAFRDDKILAVSGLNIFTARSWTKTLFYNTYTLFAYTVLILLKGLQNKLFLAANNLAIRKDVYKSLGGFKNVIGEESFGEENFALGFLSITLPGDLRGKAL